MEKLPVPSVDLYEILIGYLLSSQLLPYELRKVYV
jgi:hypothetical protein